MSPVRIQRRRSPGWRLADHVTSSAGAAYVGRGPGSKWGNPFPAYDSSPAERRTATLLFANLLYTRGDPPYPEHLVPYPTPDEIRAELAGKDLACWCPPPAEGGTDWCHAAVLLAFLDRAERTHP